MRLLIVTKQSVTAAANRAGLTTDPPAGDQTFTRALCAAGDVAQAVRAYWCSWEMTGQVRAALVAALRSEGFSPSDVATIPASQKGSFVPDPDAGSYLFAGDTNGWQPTDVLSTLGLAKVQVPKA